MQYDKNNEPEYELGIDFNIGEKVYADCDGMGQAGRLIVVDGTVAFVDFGGTYGLKETPLSSVSPYDTT